MGLSPRVRGKLRYSFIARPPLRSIPACAGEAGRRPGTADRQGVYPRVCGGSMAREWRDEGRGGLSPRVRGKRRRVPGGATSRRSIPACAGEARRQLAQQIPAEVYPRVCGGSVGEVLGGVLVDGLSPRVRGKRRRGGGAPRRRGSIPACAGEAVIISLLCRGGGVYPRVCGGSPVSTASAYPHRGLSPRVRGKRAPAGTRQRHPGSIPACAGEARRM